MSDTRFEEHTALVALLRTRGSRTSEHEIAARVLEAGSAKAVWAATRAQALLPDESDHDVLRAAGNDIMGWTS